jgi:hypothetical protein
MGLFDGTAKRLSSGPALLFPADPADAMADAVLSYDPAVQVRGDRFVFGNGVLLYGPVEVTAELARKAGLPGGMTAAYYTGIAIQGKRERRPDEVKSQDAERLIRGLAARLGGTVHDERPPMDLSLRISVYSALPRPADEVIGVLQPYVDSGKLFVHTDPDVPEDSYFLVTEQEPPFITVYWPPRLSRPRLQPPPPAVGGLGAKDPCRWELTAMFEAEQAGPEACRNVGEAALALARHTGGIATDMYHFPVTRPEDVLPR